MKEKREILWTHDGFTERVQKGFRKEGDSCRALGGLAKADGEEGGISLGKEDDYPP